MPAHIRAMRLNKEQTMSVILLDLDHYSTTFHSVTADGAIFLPELPFDVYDSFHAVKTEAECDDAGRSQ